VFGEKPAYRVAEPREQHREPAQKLLPRAAEIHAEQQPDANNAEEHADEPHPLGALVLVDANRKQSREDRS
jgi:hypothetical protein